MSALLRNGTERNGNVRTGNVRNGTVRNGRLWRYGRFRSLYPFPVAATSVQRSEPAAWLILCAQGVACAIIAAYFIECSPMPVPSS